ncbi:MAG TPA: DUF3710 domain-containing protein [Nocardioidaceae bacterium]|nr:DUF3710 domain-containing protein [Nocardioidaceae bacterium]
MFRRKKVDPADGGTEPAADEGDPDEGVAGPDPRAHGPWDVSEVSLAEDDPSRLDLGSLLVTAQETLEVQLQVEEQSGQVAAVLLAGEEGAAELRAFAAPRHGDIWDDVRRAVSAEVAQLGGTASEEEGVFGTDLVVALPLQLPDGQHAQQISRVVGIPGPRWLLRATLFGRPAVEYREDGDIESAVRDVVVVRGSVPVPPGDPLPLTMPPNAEPMAPRG